MCWIDREPPKMNKVFRIRPENINIKKYRPGQIVFYKNHHWRA